MIGQIKRQAKKQQKYDIKQMKNKQRVSIEKPNARSKLIKQQIYNSDKSFNGLEGGKQFVRNKPYLIQQCMNLEQSSNQKKDQFAHNLNVNKVKYTNKTLSSFRSNSLGTIVGFHSNSKGSQNKSQSKIRMQKNIINQQISKKQQINKVEKQIKANLTLKKLGKNTNKSPSLLLDIKRNSLQKIENRYYKSSSLIKHKDIKQQHSNSKQKIDGVCFSQKSINAHQQSNEKQKVKISQCKIFTLNPKKTVPQQIQQYIKLRQDVEIIQYFEQYKKQFFTKAKILQDYIYNSQQPQKIKYTYLNQGDSHFKNGFQAIMLKLYRNGTIVPNSYDNMRQDAVDEIQKWVIGWIHRKIMYGKLEQDQQNQVTMLDDAIKYLQDYKREINNQDTSF